MAQITRTTDELIINSLYLLGELGVGEPADNFMLSTGLELINELINKFSADSIYIPFLSTLTFNMVYGKTTYTIGNGSNNDIIADRVVDLSFANYTVPGTGFLNYSNPITFQFTANTITNLLTFSDTSAFQSGTPVTITTSGTVPSPLIAGVTYYSIRIDATTIRLASNLADALLGIPIVLLTNGVGINYINYYSGILNTGSSSIIYPLKIINKAQYYGVTRITPLNTRPAFIFLDKQDTQSSITLYPGPDQTYACSLKVKKMVDKLDEHELLTELPPFYYGFMKYALARKFLAYYPSGNWTKEAEDEFQDYYAIIKNANETDLTIRPSATLSRPEPFYWQNILAY